MKRRPPGNWKHPPAGCPEGRRARGLGALRPGASRARPPVNPTSPQQAGTDRPARPAGATRHALVHAPGLFTAAVPAGISSTVSSCMRQGRTLTRRPAKRIAASQPARTAQASELSTCTPKPG